MKASQRKKLPKSSFAYPSTRSYPIDTLARARNALARAAQSNTKGTYEHVARAVRKRWGNQIKTTGPAQGRMNKPGKRRKTRKKTR